MIVVVGDVSRREFQPVAAAIEQAGPTAAARDVDQAAEIVARQVADPRAIVLLEERPGQFSPDSIDRSRALAPLSRIVVALGAWCEGESRSGQPLPAAIGLAAVELPAWLARQERRERAGLRSAWSLPPTASEEERRFDEAAPRGRGEGTVVVSTGDAAMFDLLATVCRRRGQTAVRIREPSGREVGASAAIFDAVDLAAEIDPLVRLVAAVHPAPTVALAHFPRSEDLARAARAGAVRVLAKPFRLDELFEGSTVAVGVGLPGSNSPWRR